MKKGMKYFIKNFEEIISVFFICIMVIIVIINVILRYVFNKGIFWAEEVATISFAWSVFIGASACYKHKMNIGIDLLIKLGPIKMQRVLNVIIDLLLIIINGYIFYLSVIFTRVSAIKPTAVLGISSAYINSSLLVGFGLITIHAIRFFIQDVRSFSQ